MNFFWFGIDASFKDNLDQIPSYLNCTVTMYSFVNGKNNSLKYKSTNKNNYSSNTKIFTIKR